MYTYATVVVTYLPNREDVNNLSRLAGLSGLLIVIDNSSSGQYLSMESKHNVIIIQNKNIGLASALNKGIETAWKNGFDTIFLFDQDSRVDSRYFEKMIIFKQKFINKPCAFCVPNFFDRHSQTCAKFPILSKLKFRHASCPKVQDFVTNRLLMSITSGTLISYHNYKLIGPFKDDYFIDFIDNEYCFRAFSKGLYVAVNCDAVINHSIGLRSIRYFLGLIIKPNNHAPVRRYYIARNGIRTALDYLSLSYSYIVLLFFRLVHELLSIMLYEKNKIRKLKAIFVGLRDGILNKMGKASDY